MTRNKFLKQVRLLKSRSQKVIRKNTKLVVIFLAIVFLTVGVALASSRQPATNAAGEFIIRETKDGFIPSQLTIKQGQTVRFVSERGKPFWPASDVHPTHDIYPEFDPKTPIDPNDSWGFQFIKVGEWRFHDHLYADFTGSIIVTGDQPQAILNCPEGVVSSALEKSQRYYCWEEAIRQLASKDRLDQSFTLMSDINHSDPSFSKDCHWFGHLVGRYAYRQMKAGKSLKLTQDANNCAFGFYHGFMETLLQDNGDINMAKDLCHKANRDLEGSATRMPAVLLACYHGIGHGLTEGHEEKAGADERALVGPSLKVCEDISTNYDQAYRCAGGVFNVVSIAYTSSQYGIKINKDDPLWLCREQPDKFKEACYGDMNVALVNLTSYDLSKAAPFIEQVPQDRVAQSAMSSLAAAAVSGRLGDKDKDGYLSLVNICRNLQPRLHLYCIKGIGGGLAEYGPVDDELRPALDYCQSEFMTEEERYFCTTQLLNYGRAIYTLDKAKSYCLTVPEKYRVECNWT